MPFSRSCEKRLERVTVGTDLKLARLEVHSNGMYCAHYSETFTLISGIVYLGSVQLSSKEGNWLFKPVGLPMKKDRSDRCLRRVGLTFERLVEPRRKHWQLFECIL